MDKFKVVEINCNCINYVSNVIHRRWNVSINTALKFTDNYVRNVNDSNCYVAFANNIPIGMGVFQLDNDVDIDISPWCIGLWVEPEYRGNGLGYKITQRRFRWARKLGYKNIYLDTEKAEKYHEKFGWKKTGDICYRKNIPTVIMIHKL